MCKSRGGGVGGVGNIGGKKLILNLLSYRI